MILVSERREIAGGQIGYLRPPPAVGNSELVAIFNQHIRAKRNRLQAALDARMDEPPFGKRAIRMALTILVDIYPCLGRG